MLVIKKPKGYITLITTLIISAVISLIATSIILLGIGTSRSSFAIKESNQAKALANACAEEALQQIRSSDNFSGPGTLALSGGTCNYSVAQNGGENRTIIATGISDQMVRKVEINLSAMHPSLIIDSWSEN